MVELSEKMDITWYGMSCFRLMGRGKPAIVTDPFIVNNGNGKKLNADVVTISHDAPGHGDLEAVRGQNYLLTRPGEYEIGGVFITGIATYNEENSTSARQNIIFTFYYDDITVCHLGDLDHVPDQSRIEQLGPIDVLLIPVGGGEALSSGEAAEVISMIEPSYVIPMHYATAGAPVQLDPLEKFIKEMGLTTVKEEDTLKISTKSTVEETQVIVLRAQS